MYLAYDIRGIQQFIFSVPKLKCMIGASGLVVEFDNLAKALHIVGARSKFAAGGRGVFECSDESVEELRLALLDNARDFGMDVRFGQAEDPSAAVRNIDKLHPFVPADLDGFPCQESGLYPVPEGLGEGPDRDVHRVVQRRIQMAQQDLLGRWILRDLQVELASDAARYQLEFFKNAGTGAPAERDTVEQEEGRAGRVALGDRNRWAVIAMDGNDIGKQFDAQVSGSGEDYARISQELTDCTRRAFVIALGKAVNKWAADVGVDLERCRVRVGDRTTDRLVLPFRPLILGGDDVTLLCHSSYALQFVQDMADHFNHFSKQADLDPLWPATDGELTISAGILFCKVTFPLHMAIPYAGELLENAKDAFSDGGPKPAAVDWDHITDTLVLTPEEKRSRDLRFKDGDRGRTVHLTRRPYRLQSFGHSIDLQHLIDLADELEACQIAPSTLAQLYPRLRRPWNERVAFLASLGKRHRWLMNYLWEASSHMGEGWSLTPNEEDQSTDILDAVTVLEERHRMEQTTATYSHSPQQ